jgi:hypothetical protein
MPDFTCPACHADIEPDLVERTGQARCPFCGADLSNLGLPEPAMADVPGEMPDAAETPPTGESTRALAPVPAGSRIRIVESTADRLVLFIPPGGKNLIGLGFFALVWNLFLTVFTSLWIVGAVRGVNQGPKAPLVEIIPFFGLFWAAGLGMGWFWLRGRFERTFLLLDRERIVIQRILLGRKRLDETALGTAPRAALVESYQQNDKPVNRVEVTGANKAAKFGTALGDDEKDWLVDWINDFLGVPTGDEPKDAEKEDDEPDDDEADEADGDAPVRASSPISGDPIGARFRDAADAPGESSADADEPGSSDTLVVVVESTPERLHFWYAIAPGSPMRIFASLFLLAIGGILFAIVGYTAWNAFQGPLDFSRIVNGLYFLPFGALGLVIVAFALFIAFGRTTIDLTREQLVCQWSVGPVRYARRLPTASLHSVRVVRTSNNRVKNKRVQGSSSGPYTTCVASDGARTLPLTFLNDEPLAKQVASLVNRKLREMGF